MSKRIKYLLRAMSLASLVMTTLPLYMADGKITIKEMVDFIRQVLEIGGWKAHIEIPEDLIETSLSFTLED